MLYALHLIIPWLRITINQLEIVPHQQVDKDHLHLDTGKSSTRTCMFANTEIRSRGIECSQMVSVKIGGGGMSHVEKAQPIECIRIREDGNIVGERPGGAEDSCSFGQISTVKECDII